MFHRPHEHVASMRVAVDKAVVENHGGKHLAHLQIQAKDLVVKTGSRFGI